MIDRIFSAVLTFGLLIAGTVAIGVALFGQDRVAPAHSLAVAQATSAQLQPVAKTEAADPPTQRTQ